LRNILPTANVNCELDTNDLDLAEAETYTNAQSMPFTGANMPLVSNTQFTFAVGNILRKMMATGPGSGVVELSSIDDIDQSSKVDGYVLAYKPNVAPLTQPYKWQAADTPPAGDIHDIVTASNSGLAGGAPQTQSVSLFSTSDTG
jgi:hypothetical protein